MQRQKRNIHWHIERCADVALSSQVIYFIGPDFDEHRNQTVDIKDIAIVHVKLQRSSGVPLSSVNLLIQAVHEQMLDAALVESRRVALDAVNFVTLANDVRNYH